MSIDKLPDDHPGSAGDGNYTPPADGLDSSKHAGAPVHPTEMKADARVEKALAGEEDIDAFMRPATKTSGENEGDEASEAPPVTYDMSIYQEKYNEQMAENITVERHVDAAFFGFQANKYKWAFKGDGVPEGATYEWTGEHGELGPRDLPLEQELFSHDFIQRAGKNLEAYGNKTFEIQVMAHEPIYPILEVNCHHHFFATLGSCICSLKKLVFTQP
jgi:hypothetical protein